KSAGGFAPASSHATNSSRDCSGVISIWSRAMQIPDLGRFGRTRAVSGDIRGPTDPGMLEGEQYHRAGAPSLAASAGASPQEQPNRSSSPQSFSADRKSTRLNSSH